MKLAVIGSRSFSDYSLLLNTVQGLNPTLIISGGAKGADSLARDAAAALSIELREFLPDWKTYGRGAGPMRNRKIIEAADTVLAFWDGASKGTKNSIDIAKLLNKPCIIKILSNTALKQ